MRLQISDGDARAIAAVNPPIVIGRAGKSTMSVGAIKPFGTGLAIGWHCADGARPFPARLTMSDPRGAADERRTISPPTLVVLGASARAVAQSARRSGWSVHAADLFADLDLLEAADTVRRVGRGPDADDGYPEGLAVAAGGFPPGPWCYTGAIENHPDLIDRIAAVRPLAGNAGPLVRRVRDPFALGEALRESGLRFPETHADPDSLPADGSFVVKPLSTAGGRGIRRWTGRAPTAPSITAGPDAGPANVIWQRWIEGDPFAAAYVLADGRSRLVGLTRQFVGMPWCHAGPHAYCGSLLLPLATAPAGLLAQLERLGTLLASRFELVGVVGVDIVVDDDGRVVVIEVNPRPTASMELIERSGGPPIAAAHLAACGFPPPGNPPLPHAVSRRDHWSKSVLFARHDIAITASLVDRLRASGAAWRCAGWPALADLPRPGQTIPAGGPVLTIFHQASDGDALPDVVPAGLVDRTRLIDAML
jgi:predicted ATP-grasp superfamily ATP-dependent carboligase